VPDHLAVVAGLGRDRSEDREGGGDDQGCGCWDLLHGMSMASHHVLRMSPG
jgi:hypothetical protein